jgi:hypothetical protein
MQPFIAVKVWHVYCSIKMQVERDGNIKMVLNYFDLGALGFRPQKQYLWCLVQECSGLIGGYTEG